MKRLLTLAVATLSVFMLCSPRAAKAQAKSGEVLILLAHPNIESSKANKALIDAVDDLLYVTVIDLYDTPFDAAFFKDAVTRAKAVVFQFPFYWASAPSQLKKWCDEIFTPLAGTDVVKDKPLMVATTTGSDYDSYRSGGRNQFTMDELLRPYQMLANHSGMAWETPHVVYGTGTPAAAANITKGAAEYRARIEVIAEKLKK